MLRSLLGATAALTLLLAAAVPASASYIPKSGSTSWSGAGTTGVIRSSGTYQYDWGVITTTNSWNDPYSYVGRTSGSSVNLAQLGVNLQLTGTALSVDVSRTGGSVGFSASNSTCSASFTGAPNSSYTSASGSGKICVGSSHVSTSGGKYSTTGQLRVGSSWTYKTLTLTAS